MIGVQCPYCSAEIDPKEIWIGRTFPCKHCGAECRVAPLYSRMLRIIAVVCGLLAGGSLC